MDSSNAQARTGSRIFEGFASQLYDNSLLQNLPPMPRAFIKQPPRVGVQGMHPTASKQLLTAEVSRMAGGALQGDELDDETVAPDPPKESEDMKLTKYFARTRLVLMNLKQNLEGIIKNSMQAVADDADRAHMIRNGNIPATPQGIKSPYQLMADSAINKVGLDLRPLYEECVEEVMDELYASFQMMKAKQVIVDRLQSNMAMRDAELEAVATKRLAQAEKRAAEHETRVAELRAQLEEAQRKSSELQHIAAVNYQQISASLAIANAKIDERDAQIVEYHLMKKEHSSSLRRMETMSQKQNQSLVQRIEELKQQEELTQTELAKKDVEVNSLKSRVAEQLIMLEGAFARRDVTIKKAEALESIMAEVRTFFAKEGVMPVSKWIEACNEASPHMMKSKELMESEYGSAKTFLIGAHRHGLGQLITMLQHLYPPEFPSYEPEDEGGEEEVKATGPKIQVVEDFSRDTLPPVWLRLMKSPLQKDPMPIEKLCDHILELYTEKANSDKRQRFCGFSDEGLHDIILKLYIKRYQTVAKAEDQLCKLIQAARSFAPKHDGVHMFCQFLGLKTPAISVRGLQLFVELYKALKQPYPGAPDLYKDAKGNMLVHHMKWRPLLTGGTMFKAWNAQTRDALVRKADSLWKDTSKNSPSYGMTNMDALMRVVIIDGWSTYDETVQRKLGRAFDEVDVTKDGMLSVYQLRELIGNVRPSVTFTESQVVDIYYATLMATEADKSAARQHGALAKSCFIQACNQYQVMAHGSTLPPAGSQCLTAAVEPFSAAARIVGALMKSEKLSNYVTVDQKLAALDKSVNTASSDSVVACWESLQQMVLTLDQGRTEMAASRAAAQKDAQEAADSAAKREDELKQQIEKQKDTAANAGKMIKAAEDRAANASSAALKAQKAAEERAQKAEKALELAHAAAAAAKKSAEEAKAKAAALGRDSSPAKSGKGMARSKSANTGDHEHVSSPTPDDPSEVERLERELSKALKRASTAEAKYAAARAEASSAKERSSSTRLGRGKSSKSNKSRHSSQGDDLGSDLPNDTNHESSAMDTEPEESGTSHPQGHVHFDASAEEQEGEAPEAEADDTCKEEEPEDRLTVLYGSPDMHHVLSEQGKMVSSSGGRLFVVPSLKDKLRPHLAGERRHTEKAPPPDRPMASTDGQSASVMSSARSGMTTSTYGGSRARSGREAGALLQEAVLHGADMERLTLAVLQGVVRMGGFPRITANGRLLGLRLPGVDGRGGINASFMASMVEALHRLYVFNAGLILQQLERAEHLRNIDEGVEARFMALEEAAQKLATQERATKAAAEALSEGNQKLGGISSHVEHLHSVLISLAAVLQPQALRSRPSPEFSMAGVEGHVEPEGYREEGEPNAESAALPTAPLEQMLLVEPHPSGPEAVMAQLSHACREVDCIKAALKSAMGCAYPSTWGAQQCEAAESAAQLDPSLAAHQGPALIYQSGNIINIFQTGATVQPQMQQQWQQQQQQPPLQLVEMGHTAPPPPTPRAASPYSPAWLDLAINHDQANAVALPAGEDLITLSNSLMRRTQQHKRYIRPSTAVAAPQVLSSQERRPFTARARVERLMLRAHNLEMEQQLWHDTGNPRTPRSSRGRQGALGPQSSRTGRESEGSEELHRPLNLYSTPGPGYTAALKPSVRADATGKLQCGWFSTQQGGQVAAMPDRPRLPPLRRPASPMKGRPMQHPPPELRAKSPERRLPEPVGGRSSDGGIGAPPLRPSSDGGASVRLAGPPSGGGESAPVGVPQPDGGESARVVVPSSDGVNPWEHPDVPTKSVDGASPDPAAGMPGDPAGVES